MGGCVVWLVDTAPPTPTRNPPWRGARFASPWRRVAPGFALRLALPRSASASASVDLATYRTALGLSPLQFRIWAVDGDDSVHVAVEVSV